MEKGRKLSEEYFLWLCNKVRLRNKRLHYTGLVKLLHEKKYYWSVRNDENRNDDGLALRATFVDEHDLDQGHLEIQYFLKGEYCSVFEMLVGVAERMNDILWNIDTQENNTAKWFHELLTNLRLEKFTDDSEIDPMDDVEIEDILGTFLSRTYDFFGNRGLFPLKKRPLKDQTRVEVWYQMMAYLAENYV